MAITSFSPTFGRPGTDVEIVGTGFDNATGALVNGVPAPFLKVSDTAAIVSIPATATTGKITILDPDGDQISATDFTVQEPPVSTAPENTARGREAMNALVLATAAKNRGDKTTVQQTFARDLHVRFADGMRNSIAYPSGPTATPADVSAYQNQLFALMPNDLTLEKMIIIGSTVEVHATNGDGDYRRFLLRQSGGGYQIVSVTLG